MRLSNLAMLLESSLQGEDREFTSICTDTRELMPGQLFVALKGENFDGHAFLNKAYEKKAAGVLVSSAHMMEIPSIKVQDTRLALGKIAAHHRMQFPNLPIIAVTGSCGKTTTKAIIASILDQMGPAVAPVRSFNNDVGVPLTLLQLTKDHQFAVIEMGANHAGEISYLGKMTRHTVAVITNVAPVHLAGFGSLEGIAKAKAEIYQTLSSDGTAIINADSPYFDFFQQQISSQRTLTFGLVSKADVTASNIHLSEGNATFEVTYPGGKVHVTLPLLGKHNVMNALAAISATYAIGATPQAIEQGLKNVVAVGKRLVQYQGFAGSKIIDDTYNANPLAVDAALELLSQRSGEKIFVFGGMAELGNEEKKFHIEIGERAQQLGIDKLYACGQLSRHTVQAFGKNGFHFEDQASLIAALKPLLHSEVTVLVKGSRTAKMENIVQAFLSGNSHVIMAN